MKLRLSKGKFLVGVLSFVMAFLVCTPAVAVFSELCNAVYDRNLEEVKRLVAAGANVNCCGTCFGRYCDKTPLHIAAKKGYFEIVKYLVTEGHADVNCKDKDGHSPLSYAGLETASFLLANGANAESKNAALCKRAYEGKVGYVHLLIDNGADVNCRGEYTYDYSERTDSEGTLTWRQRLAETPLQLAIDCSQVERTKRVEVAKLLIKHGAELSSSYGGSVLDSAVKYGFARWMVEEGGVSANYVDSRGRTLLICALDLIGDTLFDPKPLEFAKWLIESKGVDIRRVPIGSDGTTHPPAFAAMYFDAVVNNEWPSYVEFSKWLVERDAHVKDEWGFAPLHIAAFCGDLDSVNWLLSKGVDVNGVKVSKNKVPIYMGRCSSDIGSIGGITALSEAVCGGHLEVVESLLKHGAKANLADENGNTPLHIAARKGNIAIGELLIDKGLSYVNFKNKAGETPIVVAKKNKHYDFAQMLIKHGATDEEPSSCLVM